MRLDIGFGWREHLFAETLNNPKSGANNSLPIKE